MAATTTSATTATTDTRQLTCVYAVLAVIVLVNSLAGGFRITSSLDSGTYIAAFDPLFNSGNIDYLRTPLYPLFLHLCIWCAGANAMVIVATLQLAALLLSVATLHRTITSLTNNRLAIFAGTALYAWNFDCITWATVIAPESFAISLTVLFARQLVAIVQGKGATSHFYKLAVTLSAMVMLRPFFVCLSPLPIIAVIIHLRRHRNAKALLHTLLPCALCAALLTGYCLEFKRQHGIFAFSYVSSLNTNQIAVTAFRQPNLRHSQMDTLATSFTAVRQANTQGDPHKVLSWRVSNPEIMPVQNADFLRNHWREMAHYKLLCFPQSAYYSYPTATTQPLHFITFQMQKLGTGTIYMLLLLALAMQLLPLRKRHLQDSLPSLTLLACCAAIIFTAVAGSNGNEFPRLMMPMLPLLTIIAARVIAQAAQYAKAL